MRRYKLLLLAGFIFLASAPAFAAVGCDLNDPDRDVQRFFPQSTGYRTDYYTVKKAGGEKMLARIETRLGDKFKGLFETIEVPYTVYTVLKNKETIGYIHGVNQKGEYGGIQVFLALDPKGTILALYFQKLTAQYGGKFRDKSFGAQFRGLKLDDFSGKLAVANPVPEADRDYRAILRGVKKNLILMDEFVFKGRAK
jgi:hypothetical protein